MKRLILFTVVVLIFSCENGEKKFINEVNAKAENIQEKVANMVTLPYPDSLFEIFEMQEGEVTYVMKKYYLVFLKTGPNRDHAKEEADKIQQAHLANLEKLANEKRICMVGPLGETDSDIRGIVILSVPNKEEAERLMALDPAVQAGRLIVEVHPWWAAKGSELF